ncbi:MAG: hypothetical protein Q8N99_07890 [Nanoarchaeota archaeon]|nr:hypothetical protein [Nanoarchaeota archaeon]
MEKEAEIQEIKEKLLELTRQVERLEKSSKKNIKSETKKEKHNVNEDKKKYIRLLIILIIILFLVDIISVLAYYKPDFSKLIPKINSSNSRNDNGVSKCNDGTIEGECSKVQPYYCYERELLKKAATCGCSKGYKIAFQDCKKI